MGRNGAKQQGKTACQIILSKQQYKGTLRQNSTKVLNAFFILRHNSPIWLESRCHRLDLNQINAYLKSMNWVSSVCHSSNASIRIHKTIFSFYHVTVSCFSVGFLIPSSWVTHSIIVMKVAIFTVRGVLLVIQEKKVTKKVTYFVT